MFGVFPELSVSVSKGIVVKHEFLDMSDRIKVKVQVDMFLSQ